MISKYTETVGSTAYEANVVEDLHHKQAKERPSGFRRISLKSLPSQTRLKISQSNALIPKVDLKILTLCMVWYATSILSNNSSKMILRQFKHPVTLTQFQFVLTQALCIMTSYVLSKDTNSKIKKQFPPGTFPNNNSLSLLITPTKILLMSALPMGAFQFIGHITTHKATSVIPVSLVHTIKALSPITTVLIYRVLFNKKFNFNTYLTLIPLVIGVMLSCLKQNSTTMVDGYTKGCFFAFLSMIIFVSQNIFAKKILTSSTKQNSILPHNNTESSGTELDKLTILYWCSTVGFCLTLPVYLVSEFASDSISLNQLNWKILNLLVINGVSHFIQSLMAFQILGLISTVNYSIVNILKRICVIMASIFYERQKINSTQSIGLILTMFGLYSYDKWGKTK